MTIKVVVVVVVDLERKTFLDSSLFARLMHQQLARSLLGGRRRLVLSEAFD